MWSKVSLISRRLSRRKTYTENEDGDLLENSVGTGPKLLRILSLFDLTFLGIGSTLGVGIYVLAGNVAKDLAGPAVSLSFLIAAAASGIAALCYAEFGARVPKAGSAYIYSYVTVGEFIAFTIGWNLILEYLIGSASVARALSLNVDSMSNHSMSSLFTATSPIHLPFMSAYADWLSMSVTLLMTVILAIGVKSSSVFTNVFTTLNLSVVIFVIFAGIEYADYENWKLPATNATFVNQNMGVGGFFPFGISGVMAGAAKCFFGFVGFDSITAAGEEAKSPKRNVPLSILLTLSVVLFAYVGVSIVLTLMIPYYLQDKETPLVHAFQQVGHSWVAWIVVVGSTFGLTASLLGAMIPMPRIVYAMAKDGLLLRCLAAVHPRFKTPFTATLLTGSIAAVFAMVTDLDSLVEMMSIGTLLAYTLVAVSILVLRYEQNSKRSMAVEGSLPWQREPTAVSSKRAKFIIFAFCILTILLCAVMVPVQKSEVPHSGSIIVIAFTAILMVGLIMYLIILPRSTEPVYFMVPLVPFLPAISIWINTYLMFQLSIATWLRFAIWMSLGLFVYGGYGISHSTLEREALSSVYPFDEDLSPLVVNENPY